MLGPSPPPPARDGDAIDRDTVEDDVEARQSAAGPGYTREWALFCDYTAATGQPALPTTVEALRGFLTQLPAAAGTQGRRVTAIAAAHRKAGYLLERPAADSPPPTFDARPGSGELIAACPTRGWPDGFLGRRDAFLIVLTTVLSYPHTRARRIPPADLTWDNQVWRVGPHLVPTEQDPRRCPSCTLVRWLDILGIADGLGRGSARMHLAAAHAPAALDPHHHTPPEPQRWRATAQLLPVIDQHGWIDDYQPLSTRTIRTRLALAARRAHAGTATESGADTAARPPAPRESRNLPADHLDEVLAQLDKVAADADALNARIKALLAGGE